MGEEAHERLLRGVLGGGAVEDAPTEPEHERMEPGEGRLQGRAIPVRDAGEVGAERRSFIGLRAPSRAEGAAGAARTAREGGGEGDAGDGQPHDDEGEETLVHDWLRAGKLGLTLVWAVAPRRVTGHTELGVVASRHPQEPSVAQLGAALRDRHHWKPATDAPMPRQARPRSSLRVASQVSTAEPSPADRSNGTRNGTVQHAAHATRPTMAGVRPGERAGFTGGLLEAATAGLPRYGPLVGRA